MIKKIDKISCSLNLGLIYSLSYDYQPQDGVKINISFVSEDGTYNTDGILSATKKVQIIIGSAVFNMYAVDYKLQYSTGKRVIEVSFEDETFKLENVRVVLTGRGCGLGTYQLGRFIDLRTDVEKATNPLNPDVEAIKALTEFQDLEYSFSEFIAILQQEFLVNVTVTFDDTIYRPFVGTFKEVLNNWCSYFNFSYYFENGVLNVINPSTLNIIFPDPPADALDYNIEETIKNTYDKTASIYFQQPGGEIQLSNLDNEAIQFVNMWPAGSQAELPQQDIDLKQVAAAQYGPEYWFIYNYYLGTAGEECGWKRSYTEEVVQNFPNASITQTIQMLTKKATENKQGGIAYIDTEYFNQRFEFYKTYGEQIAGRYYISEQRGSPFTDELYSWILNGAQPLDAQSLPSTFDLIRTGNGGSVSYFKQGDGDDEKFIVDGTKINRFFEGVMANEQRIIYKDNYVIDLKTQFTLDDNTKNFFLQYFNTITKGLFGSESFDYSEISGGSIAQFVTWFDHYFNSLSLDDFSGLDDKAKLFLPRYDKILLRGVRSLDIAAAIAAYRAANPLNPYNPLQNPDNIQITAFQDFNLVSNVGTIQAFQAANLVIYYEKLSQCNASSTDFGLYRRVFASKEVSVDTPVTFGYSSSTSNIYTITRNLTYVNLYSSSDILNLLAIPQIENQKTVSFSLNYLYPNVPTSFVSNGLTSMSLSLGDNGVTANYTYSNSIKTIPFSDAVIDQLEKNVKNSWIRSYSPSKAIGIGTNF